MIPKIITKSNLKKILEKMLSDHVIYAPQRINGDFDYLPLKDVEDIAFDFDRTRMSAKGIFLKPEQKLMTASRLNGKPRASDLDSTTQVLFGARPCDISAINLLDKVFTETYLDIYYVNERERTLIIGMRCSEKCRTCFCGTMDAHDPKTGYDIMLTEIDDECYLMEAGTLTGERVIRKASTLYRDAGKDDRTKIIDIMNKIDKTFSPDVSTSGFRAILELEPHEEIWQKYQDTCLACGQCTFVCPTCWCFDVKEEVAALVDGDIDKTARKRYWTSCVFQEFHKVAGGHVFKPTIGSRHEFYYNHKLKGIPEKYGVWGCVGCGRCVSTCPVNLDIRETLKSLRGVEA
ncbi:MAG: 4Fe-4S dicluster domain-containing protein [Candidatus Hodarchaeales archaeon]